VRAHALRRHFCVAWEAAARASVATLRCCVSRIARAAEVSDSRSLLVAAGVLRAIRNVAGGASDGLARRPPRASYLVLNEGNAVIVWLPLFSRASSSPPVSVPGSRNSPGMLALVALAGRYMLSSRSPWATITW
jgi:hypothetical protein